jgi:molybdopterin converting factor subunit 1
MNFKVMNKVSILFFASLKEKVGYKELNLEIPHGMSIKELKTLLRERFPVLDAILDTALMSINKEYAFDEDVIPENAEIAVFPPVSGGEMTSLPTFVDVTEDELDLNALISKVILPSTGAICVFTGVVRGITRKSETYQTEYLEYEAYRPMAESKLLQVADEIRSLYPSIEGIAIVQRIGHLEPGVPTVVVACSAAHRNTGVFEAARYGIDRLKEIVPIWKKEVGSKGEVWIEGNYHPTRDDLSKSSQSPIQ